MSSPTQTQAPSPALFFDTMNAYQRTAALKGALELEVFTAIGEGNATAASLAARCRTSERGMRILCDYLVIIGFLTKEENNYRLTHDTALFLDRRSPAYLGTAARFLGAPMMLDAYQDVAAIVRKGGEVFSPHGTMDPEHPVWIEFARSMAPMMAFPAQAIAKLIRAAEGAACKVLDIAAGHGLFGVTIARQNPNATVVAVDWPRVLEVAQENAATAGVTSRYQPLPGSAFEVEFGAGYDIVLLTNFLHHFDTATCETLLRKVARALKPGGRAITLEFVPNEDRISPPMAASFSMVMLGTTESGDAYTFSQYDQMFRNSGFKASELHPLPQFPGQIIVSHK